MNRSGDVADGTRWPEAAMSLLAELGAAPGRLALVVGSEPDRGPLDAFARALDVPVVSVGRTLTEHPAPPASPSAFALDRLATATLLDDTDILFTPELQIDPLLLLRDLGRRYPRIMRWPGTIQGGRATYSEPGRRDHHEWPISDAIVLR